MRRKTLPFWKLPRRRVRRLVKRLARGVCVLAVLAGYGVACIGLPLPKRISKDHSQPFPCADRACGCMNADECWDHCCCFTREQRLAWAVEHGVDVPAWVLNAPTEGDTSLEERGSCCQHAVAKSCCAHQQAAHSCCEKATPQPELKHAEQVEWVIGMMARKCRGQGCDWLSAGAVLPGPLPVIWQPLLPPCGELEIPSLLLETIERAPPVPPPRLWRVG